MIESMPRPKQEPAVSWTVRAPAELHERLTKYADSRGRPLNRQLLYWLAWLIDEAEAGRDPKP